MKTEERLHCTRFSFTSILQTIPFLRFSFEGDVVNGEQTPFFGWNRVIRQTQGDFFYLELVPSDFLLFLCISYQYFLPPCGACLEVG